MQSKAKVQERQRRGYKQLRDGASNIWNEGEEKSRRIALSVLALANYGDFGDAFKLAAKQEIEALLKKYLA